jgi:hypothetical protein
MKLARSQSAILRIYSTKTTDFSCGNYVGRTKKEAGEQVRCRIVCTVLTEQGMSKLGCVQNYKSNDRKVALPGIRTESP